MQKITATAPTLESRQQNKETNPKRNTYKTVRRKKAVIIGGTSGMGLATAKMLLDRGSRVLVTGA